MNTVEKRIYRLPPGQFELVSRIRELILASDPEMTEKLHFTTPFFSCRGWLCYFHLPENQGIEINFVKGALLSNKHQNLVARKRKVMRSLLYKSMEDFREGIFLEVLREAISLNHSKKKKKT